MEIERLHAQMLRKNQGFNFLVNSQRFLQIVKVDEQQSQRREALLAVNNAALPFLLADDERPEIIIVVVLTLGARIALFVFIQERIGEVGDQLFNVLLLPIVFPLEIIDRVFLVFENLT